MPALTWYKKKNKKNSVATSWEDCAVVKMLTFASDFIGKHIAGGLV